VTGVFTIPVLRQSFFVPVLSTTIALFKVTSQNIFYCWYGPLIMVLYLCRFTLIGLCWGWNEDEIRHKAFGTYIFLSVFNVSSFRFLTTSIIGWMGGGTK